MLNLPNILTISRIFVIPIVLVLIVFDDAWARWTACGLFTAAGITDFFDGYLARRSNMVSALGRFLDRDRNRHCHPRNAKPRRRAGRRGLKEG